MAAGVDNLETTTVFGCQPFPLESLMKDIQDPHVCYPSLPEEVYRMPYKRDNPLKDKTGTNPCDCFYFIPDKEGLEEIVAFFKKWSKRFGFQGKVGCSMTVGADELRGFGIM